MPVLKLDLNDRQHLSIILAAQTGNPEDTETVYSLLNKIKLTKEELEEVGLEVVGNFVSWQRKPDAEKKEIEVSLTEKKKFKSVLSSWDKYRPQDYEWLPGVLEQV